MRIAVGQLWQESNTFNRNPTTLLDFENWGIATGDAVVKDYGETGELGGFLEGCRQWDSEIDYLGLTRYVCWPWGSVEADAWSHIQNTFIEQLKRADHLDAVFLALHGAMAAEGEGDITGTLLELARRHVGKDVPIVGTLDLHANITHKMVENADLLVGYHACPHLDAFETGQRAANGLWKILQETLKPHTVWRKLPMITAAENHNTFTGVPAPLYRAVEQLEVDEEVLSAGIYMAMPWFDVDDLGWVVSLTTTKKDSKWNDVVNDLAGKCWDVRYAMHNVERFPPEDVVLRALHHEGHPIVIGDGADATNSGSPGDQTHLLKEFLKQDSIPHGAMTFLVDPEAVALARQVGVGGTFDAPVGATFAPEYCEPVPLKGRVERLLDVDFILDGHIGKNMPIHMGQGAVVSCGDVTVLLTEKSGPGSSPKLYETAGLDPKTCGIVVAKSPAGFRADYDPFVAGTYLADCPGCAGPDLAKLNFHKVNRPLWPVNELDDPAEAAWCQELR